MRLRGGGGERQRGHVDIHVGAAAAGRMVEFGGGEAAAARFLMATQMGDEPRAFRRAARRLYDQKHFNDRVTLFDATAQKRFYFRNKSFWAVASNRVTPSLIERGTYSEGKRSLVVS